MVILVSVLLPNTAINIPSCASSAQEAFKLSLQTNYQGRDVTFKSSRLEAKVAMPRKSTFTASFEIHEKFLNSLHQSIRGSSARRIKIKYEILAREVLG